jgi:uncharacterized membrane protein
MKRWLIVSIVATLLAAAGPLYLYYVRPDLLKEQIPTHSNAAGQVDKWTPREKILPQFLILPAVMAFFVLLTLVLPWLSPKGFEVDRFLPTFRFVMCLVVLMFAYIHLLLVLGGIRGVDIDLTRYLLGGLSLFFAILGNFLGKVQRNFWMGVRTPWTLASETVWIQTHRLTAWLWTGGGIVLSVIAFLKAPLWVWIAGMIGMALAPVVYSLILYKRLEKQGRLGPPVASSLAEDGR